MGLSYIGTICLLIAFVSGYKRVPEPPAKTMPLRYGLFLVSGIQMNSVIFKANANWRELACLVILLLKPDLIRGSANVNSQRPTRAELKKPYGRSLH